MRFHSQNIKAQEFSKDWIHWRCWLYFGKDEESKITFAINTPTSFWHLDVDLCQNGWQEEAIGFSIGTPLVAIWVGLENSWLYNLLEKITKRKEDKYTNGRNIGISFHDKTLWLNLWADQMMHKSSDPKWWSFNMNFEDLFLGKSKYTKKVISSGVVDIAMPEALYPAKFEIIQASWQRRFSIRRKTYIDFDIPLGIPHQGKGENSWDCGMDGTFGISEEWKGSITEAAKKVALRCLETRARYGSLYDEEYLKWYEERKNKKQEPESTNLDGELYAKQ